MVENSLRYTHLCKDRPELRAVGAVFLRCTEMGGALGELDH